MHVFKYENMSPLRYFVSHPAHYIDFNYTLILIVSHYYYKQECEYATATGGIARLGLCYITTMCTCLLLIKNIRQRIQKSVHVHSEGLGLVFWQRRLRSTLFYEFN